MTVTMRDNDPVGYLEELLRAAKSALAFVDLKRAEITPGSQIANQLYLESQQECANAMNQLGGQCIMVACDIKEDVIPETSRVKSLLHEARRLLCS